ncbi:MAG TPA: patatin-like phospholipase family protein [Vicinamibacterales bacterium]
MPAPERPSESSLAFLRAGTVFSKLPPQVFELVVSEFEWTSFEQGELLFSEGDPSDRLYLVVHGRLAITRRGNDGREIVLGWVRPGESVGELALLDGHPRTATVRASRATVTMSIERDQYEALTARVPESLAVLNQLLARRVRQVILAGREEARPADILAVVAASRDAPLTAFCERLCKVLEKEGPVLHLSAARVRAMAGEDAEAAVLSVEQRGKLLAWLNAQELRHRFIVLEADVGNTNWTARCLRHGDEILLVARADAPPGGHVVEGSVGRPGQDGFERPRRLVLIHDDAVRRPSGTGAWLDALPVADHHHVRLGVDGDMERLGRFLRRRPVSLALAGGAALGFAHIGVLRALSEAGIPIDFVCGTSMGAIVGGQIALGMSWEEVYRETRRHFRESSVYDATLPIISFFKARRLDSRLEATAGDTRIEDLWIRYFCVSSNLTNAAPEIHERGSLRRAMRASSAVPGLFPPIRSERGDVLVDGALLNNLPADLAAARNGGSVIAVNVIPTVDQVTTGGYQEGASPLQVLLTRMKAGAGMRPPTIVDLLVRGIFLPTVSAASRIRTAASLYIEPPLGRYGLLNTKPFDEIVAAGYEAAVEKLRDWRPDL